jgi:uncharacterized membrane-anchored protein
MSEHNLFILMSGLGVITIVLLIDATMFRNKESETPGLISLILFAFSAIAWFYRTAGTWLW